MSRSERVDASGRPASVATLLASALAAAEGWLLHPAEPASAPAPAAEATPPVVAVFGVSQGCGATTVARALALELAMRSGVATAAVGSLEPPSAGAVGLRTRAAAQLAREIEARGPFGARAVGRLCLAGGGDYAGLVASLNTATPIVIDSGAEAAPAAAAVAQAVVLVAQPGVEPALAEVVAASLARIGPQPLIALNRADAAPEWEGRAGAILPDARASARLAQAGRDPGRGLAAAVAALADRLLL